VARVPATGINNFFTVCEKSESSQSSSSSDTMATTSDTRVSSLTDTSSSSIGTETAGTQSDISFHNFDIAHYRDMVKGMSDIEINNLIKNVFKPGKKYVFPKTNGRAFGYEWLNMFKWQCYSPSANSAFCLSCVLFDDRFPSKSGKIFKLFSEPLLVQWNNSVFTFRKHAGHGPGVEMGYMLLPFPFFKLYFLRFLGLPNQLVSL
jgi:hypothetical protein